MIPSPLVWQCRRRLRIPFWIDPQKQHRLRLLTQTADLWERSVQDSIWWRDSQTTQHHCAMSSSTRVEGLSQRPMRRACEDGVFTRRISMTSHSYRMHRRRHASFRRSASSSRSPYTSLPHSMARSASWTTKCTHCPRSSGIHIRALC